MTEFCDDGRAFSKPADSHLGLSRSARSHLVLSLDGLSTAAIGPYGCSWLETPGWNRLASQAIVFERCTAISTDRLENLRGAMSQAAGVSVASTARQAGLKAILITDSEMVAKSELAADFDECHLVLEDFGIDSRDHLPMADCLEETRFAKLIAAALARRESLVGEPHLLWIHSSFLLEQWDAPEEYRTQDDLEELVDGVQWSEPTETLVDWEPASDEDEESENLRELLEEIQRAKSATVPPDVRWSDCHDSDLLLAWMTAYGAQIQVVDRMFEVILKEISDERSSTPTLTILSTGGFSLGENSWIGANSSIPSSIQYQLTCMIRLPSVVPLRVLRPVASDRIAATLITHIQDDSLPAIDATKHRDLCDRVDRDEESICLRSLYSEWSPERWATPVGSMESSIQTQYVGTALGLRIATTQGWFYWAYEGGEEHLYLKPDDRFDANDIAKLKPEILELFREGFGAKAQEL